MQTSISMRQGVDTRRPHVTCVSATRQTVVSRPMIRSSLPQKVLSRDCAVFALGGPGDRKGLKREDEPEEYWSSERERKGESPFKDPVAIIGILAILFPFILLLILSAAGVVDLSPQ